MEREKKQSQEEVLADLKLSEPPLKEEELFYLQEEDKSAFCIRREKCYLHENEVARQERIQQHPHNRLLEQYELWVKTEYEEWAKHWPPKDKLPLSEVQTFRALLFGHRYFPNCNLWFHNCPLLDSPNNKEEADKARARRIEHLRHELYCCIAGAADLQEYATDSES